MATCVRCGTWAGIGKKLHDFDCTPMKVAYASEADEIVRRLTPVILRAGIRAGVAAAGLFFGLSVFAYAFFFIVHGIFTTP